MTKKYSFRKFKKRFLRLIAKHRPLLVIASLVVIVLGWIVMNPKDTINPTAYAPLLEVIAKGESRGNYNAYFGQAGNTDIRFTEMTIAEVLAWQENYLRQGSPSNAVGRYQIIEPTLRGLVESQQLDTAQLFDTAIQDRLAIALMERRGSIAYIRNEVQAEDFAHNLSKEWAALPQVVGDAPEKSYYDGDGLNASRIDSASILGAIASFKSRAAN